MSAISKESVSQEAAAAVEICETDDGLVEVGAVTETRGGPWGPTPDAGNGFQFV